MDPSPFISTNSNKPYDNCGCKRFESCGNGYKASIALDNHTTLGGSPHTAALNAIGILQGTTDPQIKLVPSIYRDASKEPFGVWNGHMTDRDSNQPKTKKYTPPVDNSIHNVSLKTFQNTPFY